MHIAQLTADQGFITIKTTQDFDSPIHDLAAAYHAKACLTLRRQDEHSRHSAAFDHGRDRYQQPAGTCLHVEDRT